MYEYIIFDVDGTLIDTHQATILALQKVLAEETGKRYDAHELEFVIGIPGEVSLPKLGIKDVDLANKKWNFYLKNYSNKIEVYPGIRELLPFLINEGIDIGLVTSNTRYELEGLMYHFLPLQLEHYVNYSVCADDTLRHKPHPDPILKYLELSGAEPSKVLFIGDTEYDMECADAASVDFGLAAWGLQSIKPMNCRYSFKHPYEINKLLDKEFINSKGEIYAK
jgi:HAD superfamily hydrolase (TIGR01549 family)